MEILCNKCISSNVVKAGYKKLKNSKIQRYKCNDCKTFFTGQEKFNHLNEESKKVILEGFKENLYLHDIANKLNVKLRTVQHQLEKAFENDSESKNTIIENRQKFRNENRSKNEITKIKAYYKLKSNNTIQNSCKNKIIGFKW